MTFFFTCSACSQFLPVEGGGMQWGHGTGTYMFTAAPSSPASSVAPISCSQSLFVIVAAAVPARASRPFFLASVRSDRSPSFFCFFPFFRLSHLAAASWVMSPIRLWPCHPKVAHSFAFAARLLGLPKPSIIALACAVNLFRQGMQLCMKSSCLTFVQPQVTSTGLAFFKGGIWYNRIG